MGTSAATTGPYRVARATRTKWISWETFKKLREIVGSEDSLRQGKKQYPAVRKGRASNASTPIVLEFDRMTATLHLGVSAREMAAPRLECGGERCDSAGKC